MKRFSVETKVGFFALAIVIVIAWATIRVSDQQVVAAGGYDVSFAIDSAGGLKLKAPVELAGVEVGVVRSIDLADSRMARVTIRLNRRVQLPSDSQAVLRSRGFLGETYVELIPGTPGAPLIGNDGTIDRAVRTGDINSLISQFGLIADDMKAITGSVRTMVGQQDAPVDRVLANLDQFTAALRDVTLRNTDHIDRIASNMADLTAQLNMIVSNSGPGVEDSIAHLNSVTAKLDSGQGTLGKLINDDETLNKINDSLDGLNQTFGTARDLELSLGFHTEYLARSEDFKNYVHFALSPTPDKAVLIDLVSDPAPRPQFVERTTTVTSGGTTSNVQTLTGTIDQQQLQFSVQLAKKFYDWRVRGGIIESSGGMGVDYTRGPFGAHFDAFQFSTRFNQRPHLKAMATVALTRNFTLLGGADDFINPSQPVDYFVGAGFRFIDDDIKSLARFGGTSLLNR